MFLGEEIVDVTNVPKYAKNTPFDWAMVWIEKYGSIDGDHHKAWVIDQVSRIYYGTPVIVSIARWDDHPEEVRVELGTPSAAYEKWVADIVAEGYEVNPGIAP